MTVSFLHITSHSSLCLIHFVTFRLQIWLVTKSPILGQNPLNSILYCVDLCLHLNMLTVQCSSVLLLSLLSVFGQTGVWLITCPEVLWYYLREMDIIPLDIISSGQNPHIRTKSPPSAEVINVTEARTRLTYTLYKVFSPNSSRKIYHDNAYSSYYTSVLITHSQHY